MSKFCFEGANSYQIIVSDDALAPNFAGLDQWVSCVRDSPESVFVFHIIDTGQGQQYTMHIKIYTEFT